MTEYELLNFTSNDKFYIFGAIDETMPKNIIAPFIAEVNKKSKVFNPSPIEIFINSLGGYSSIANIMTSEIERAKKLNVPVHTIWTSDIASAASHIAVAGHKRFVTDTSSCLLHYARAWDYGHNPEMQKRNYEQTVWLQENIVKHYKKYTRLKNIEKLLEVDNYYVMGAKELINKGLADEIYN